VRLFFCLIETKQDFFRFNYIQVCFMIVNPNLTTHTIKLVPRFSTSNVLTLTVTDSTLGTSTDLTTTYTTGGDYKLALTFDYTFTAESSYQLKLTDSVTSEIVYRGLVLATTQNSQTYKLTDNLYRW
jgi:uncharacterized membrane protein